MVTGAEATMVHQTLSEEEIKLKGLVHMFVSEVDKLEHQVGCALFNDGASCYNVYTSSTLVPLLDHYLEKKKSNIDTIRNDILSTAGSRGYVYEKLKALGLYETYNKYDSEARRLATIELTEDGRFELTEQALNEHGRTDEEELEINEMIGDLIEIHGKKVEEFVKLVEDAKDHLAEARTMDEPDSFEVNPEDCELWQGKTCTIAELKGLLYNSHEEVLRTRRNVANPLSEEYDEFGYDVLLGNGEYESYSETGDEFFTSGRSYKAAADSLLVPEYVTKIRGLFKCSDDQSNKSDESAQECSFRLRKLHKALDKAEGGDMDAWYKLTAGNLPGTRGNRGNTLFQIFNACVYRDISSKRRLRFDSLFEHFAKPSDIDTGVDNSTFEVDFCRTISDAVPVWTRPIMKSWEVPETDFEGLADLASSAL